MKNVIILGCGRSGTSMLAGMVSNDRYFIGTDYIKPRGANPKGFFEGREINTVNERLIAGLTPNRDRPRLRFVKPSRLPGAGQRWLARIPAGVEIPEDPAVERQIREITKRAPYCFKDPRFCYTLPVWRRHLKNEVYLCIHRDPADTVESILNVCRSEPYLKNLRMDAGAAYELWHLMYARILDEHAGRGSWMFLHYDQVFRAETIRRIERAIGAKLRADFADKRLNRAKGRQAAPDNVMALYSRLNRLAEHDPAR